MIGRLAELKTSRASPARITRPTIATMMGLRSDSGFMAGRLICLPPSRALGLGPRWLREAGPRRRDTATAPGAPYAAFGPAPAARRQGLRLTEAVSLPAPRCVHVDAGGVR